MSPQEEGELKKKQIFPPKTGFFLSLGPSMPILGSLPIPLHISFHCLLPLVQSPSEELSRSLISYVNSHNCRSRLLLFLFHHITSLQLVPPFPIHVPTEIYNHIFILQMSFFSSPLGCSLALSFRASMRARRSRLGLASLRFQC